MNTPTHPSDATIESGWTGASWGRPPPPWRTTSPNARSAPRGSGRPSASCSRRTSPTTWPTTRASPHHPRSAAGRRPGARGPPRGRCGGRRCARGRGDADALPPAVAAPRPAPPPPTGAPGRAAGLGSVVALAAAALLFLRPGPSSAPCPATTWWTSARPRCAPPGRGRRRTRPHHPEGGFQIRLAPQAATEGRAVQARVFAVADGRALPCLQRSPSPAARWRSPGPWPAPPSPWGEDGRRGHRRRRRGLGGADGPPAGRRGRAALDLRAAAPHGGGAPRPAPSMTRPAPGLRPVAAAAAAVALSCAPPGRR